MSYESEESLEGIPRDHTPARYTAGPGRGPPFLSAHNQHHERWRIRRLVAVTGFLAAGGLLGFVARLHDHKGQLTVITHGSVRGGIGNQVRASLLGAAITAWMSCIGDGSNDVQVVGETDLPTHVPTTPIPEWMR
jgi:hypothetical protein